MVLKYQPRKKTKSGKPSPPVFFEPIDNKGNLIEEYDKFRLPTGNWRAAAFSDSWHLEHNPLEDIHWSKIPSRSRYYTYSAMYVTPASEQEAQVYYKLKQEANETRRIHADSID